MTLSKRLTRAGAAFLIFGTCAAMLPGTSGSFMTASDACTSSSNNNAGEAAGYAGGLLLLFLALDQSLYAGETFTAVTSSDTGSAPSQVGYNDVTSAFQFNYGAPSQG